MDTQTSETCWFCETNEADSSACVVEKLYRGEKGNWETVEVSIPRCSNCVKVHAEIASPQPQSKEPKKIPIMGSYSANLSSVLLGTLAVAGFFLITFLTNDEGLGCVITGGITLAGAVLWAIIGGLKQVKANTQLLSELGIKGEHFSGSHPDVKNLTEEGWNTGEPPRPKKARVPKPRPVKRVTRDRVSGLQKFTRNMKAKTRRGLDGISSDLNFRKLERDGNIDGLIDALNHEDLGIRRKAAAALGRLGNPRAVDSLIMVLTDRTMIAGQHLQLLEDVAKALGEIGDQKAVNHLRSVAEQEYSIRVAADSLEDAQRQAAEIKRNIASFKGAAKEALAMIRAKGK